MIREQALTPAGHAIGGAIAVSLALGLDTRGAAAKHPVKPEED